MASSKIFEHIIQQGHSLTMYEIWQEIQNVFLDYVNAQYMKLRFDFNNAHKDTYTMTECL